MTNQQASFRIGIATERIPARTGVAHYVAYLDEALRANAQHGQVVVGPKFAPPEAGSPNLLRVQLRKIGLLRRLRRLLRANDVRRGTRYWRDLASDVICVVPHVFADDEGIMDEFYATLTKRRLIWVIHDLHGFHFPDQWPAGHLAVMHRRFRSLSECAAGVIVHNGFTAADVHEKLGIAREKIAIVGLPCFFSLETYVGLKERDTEVLKKLGISSPYALWASSSTYSHKNHERLLQAWRILLDRGHRLQLVCTGAKEPRWEAVNACIRQLGLQSSVCFTDLISDSEMATILRNAHLAVCPTLFEGGGPGPAAEAVMASIPLAASNIPQVQQLFDDRPDMIVSFDPTRPEAIAAAVETIIGDYPAAMRRAIGARAEYSKMRTWEITAHGYWSAIEQAVSRSLRLAGQGG